MTACVLHDHGILLYQKFTTRIPNAAAACMYAHILHALWSYLYILDVKVMVKFQGAAKYQCTTYIYLPSCNFWQRIIYCHTYDSYYGTKDWYVHGWHEMKLRHITICLLHIRMYIPYHHHHHTVQVTILRTIITITTITTATITTTTTAQAAMHAFSICATAPGKAIYHSFAIKVTHSYSLSPAHVL